MKLVIAEGRLESIEAAALLVPVDGQLCRLGGAAASALRLALPPEERDLELEYVEDQLAQMRPLPHPQARAIDGVARWSTLIVSAAYPHDVDGASFAPDACARMVRAALPAAIAVAGEHGVASLAAALIGTQYRMPVELAVNAFADGLAAARSSITFVWSLPEAAPRELALAAGRRLGLC